MAITRRQFLKRTSVATAGTLLAPSLFKNPFVQQALADTIGDRYLVVIFLDGGNDGLNTVTPWDDGTTGALRAAYESVRHPVATPGGIQLLESELSATHIGTCLTTGTPLAIHPSMTRLKSLYNAGKMAVIQGCGYPDYNLSHEQSRSYWQSGNPSNALGYTNGWVGRYFAQAGYGGVDIPAVSVNDEIAAEFRQTITSVLATRNLNNLEFPYDQYNIMADEAAKRACFEALYGSAASSAQGTLSYVANVGNATLTATDNYASLPGSPLYADYVATGMNTSTARDLRQVAKVINAVRSGNPNIGARHFQLRNGGYDTHSDQGGAAVDTQHFNLHKELSDAISLFYDDCVEMGVQNKVLLMVYSEFSRRIEQNDSGTDHGSQGPMFIVGGGITGGVYGSHPDLNTLDDDGNTSYSQAPGDPYRSTDFRDVYGTILRHWLNIPENTINNFILPVDAGNPNLYWTSRNFNMGFLP